MARKAVGVSLHVDEALSFGHAKLGHVLGDFFAEFFSGFLSDFAQCFGRIEIGVARLVDTRVQFP